jgi:hypothetical protein
VRKTKVDAIREEVKSRGLLETNETGGLTNKGRVTFHRAKADLIAAKSHIESEGFFWRLSPTDSPPFHAVTGAVTPPVSL